MLLSKAIGKAISNSREILKAYWTREYMNNYACYCGKHAALSVGSGFTGTDCRTGNVVICLICQSSAVAQTEICPQLLHDLLWHFAHTLMVPKRVWIEETLKDL